MAPRGFQIYVTQNTYLDPTTYTANGVPFVEGCKPDHGRVIVAYRSTRTRVPSRGVGSS
ncbi:hypothetical protein MHPYR_10276 [uncultured Mycobacterium sp.]|uniref:Uncharacterized protein n=1 Tax=uncultured Mycobacterium sp. TaxID=171292 RepID=A0A1Y5NWH9_9MYCO|nr:hypothetical protein MHPYR_10276 [uncultured Mycobacterium sp.]